MPGPPHLLISAKQALAQTAAWEVAVPQLPHIASLCSVSMIIAFVAITRI